MNSGPSILLIDDNEDVARSLAFVLDRAGYRTFVMSSGADGLQGARISHPSLVISDLKMPDMKGDQVLEAFRHDPATAAIPVILLTGYDESVTSEMKADAVVTKPFDIKHILEVVRSLLQNNPGSPLI